MLQRATRRCARGGADRRAGGAASKPKGPLLHPLCPAREVDVIAAAFPRRPGWAPVLFLLILVASPASAQRLDAFSLRWDTRYDNVDLGEVKDRVQGSVRLALTVDVWSLVEVVGFASTGDSYTSRWTDLYDFREAGSDSDFSVYFRRLFVQRAWDWGRVQLGAIPPIKNVASGTGLNSAGWVDGGRVEVYVGELTVELVGGSITDLDNPDLFSRDLDLNFAELELTWDVLPNLTLEATGEWLADEVYLRTEGRLELGLWSNRRLQLWGEFIANVSRQVVAGDIGLAFDLGHWLSGDIEDRLVVQVDYRHLDREIGLRGALVDDFFIYGHALTVELEGDLVEGGVVHWFSRNIFADQPRFLVGVGFRFAQ